MQKKHMDRVRIIVFYSAIILVIGLLLAFIYWAYIGLSTGSGIFHSRDFLLDLSSILFWMGGAVLTFGAFFIKAQSPTITRVMVMPYQALTNMEVYKLKDQDAAREEESGSGGVTCIIIGALIIIISLLFAIVLAK